MRLRARLGAPPSRGARPPSARDAGLRSLRLPRRRFLRAAAGLGAGALSAATLPGCVIQLDEGLFNDCREEPLPDRLRRHPLVQAAWEEIDPAKVWDSHVHLAGTGDSGSGAWVNPLMLRWTRPFEYAHAFFYFDGACVRLASTEVDRHYVERLLALTADFPPGARFILYALDRAYDAKGQPRDDQTVFHVPNAYAAKVAADHPARFGWMASIHPYRPEAVPELDACVRDGALGVKWVPSAMRIDPASPRCDAFYEALARHGLPLVAHGGAEHPLLDAPDELNNPLRLRRAMEHGVRVVVAHCATQGDSVDLDRGPDGPPTPSFALFERMMDDPRWLGLLHADISGVTQFNRGLDQMRIVLRRADWQPRLLNGSDYPLPGILPVISVEQFVKHELLAPGHAAVLREIRAYNALLFDFVLKRSLRWASRGFLTMVFQTRDFFRPRPPDGTRRSA